MEVQKYISGIITGKDQKLYAIYCMPDHTHLLVSIRPHIAISDLVRDMKSGSSTFIKKQGWVSNFEWQDARLNDKVGQGFGAFSYSKSQAPKVVDYILNQPEHHRKKTFKEEYLKLLKIFEIDYDEKYLFEFFDWWYFSILILIAFERKHVALLELGEIIGLVKATNISLRWSWMYLWLLLLTYRSAGAVNNNSLDFCSLLTFRSSVAWRIIFRWIFISC